MPSAFPQDPDERRRARRVRFSRPIRVAAQQTSRIGVTVDLSRSGLRITHASDLEVGQRTRCAIALGSREPELQVPCRVVWVDKKAKAAGLAFDDVTDGTHRRLETLISRLEHRHWNGTPIDSNNCESGTWAPDEFLD